MSGLEIVAVVPFLVAAWRLGKKVTEQQHLIEQHEMTINNQQEVLETLVNGTDGAVSVPAKVVAFGSVVVFASITAHYVFKLQQLRRNVQPPANYEPTAATFEAEECKVCLSNRKDTFFSPCQHYVTCWDCSQKLLGKPCPICRRTVEFTQFTFDA